MIPIRPVKKKEEIDLSILPSKRLLHRSTDNGIRRKKRRKQLERRERPLSFPLSTKEYDEVSTRMLNPNMWI